LARRESISTRLPVLVLLLAGLPLGAGDCRDLATEARAAAGRKEYAKSADLYQKAVKAGARDPRVLYDATCAAALAGRSDQAFAFLEKALAEGLFGVATLKSDEDLASLRDDARWPAVLARAESSAVADRRFWAKPVLAPPTPTCYPRMSVSRGSRGCDGRSSSTSRTSTSFPVSTGTPSISPLSRVSARPGTRSITTEAPPISPPRLHVT